MIKSQTDIKEGSAFLFPAYTLGLKNPSGHIYIRDVHPELPSEEVQRQFDEFVKRLEKPQKSEVSQGSLLRGCFHGVGWRYSGEDKLEYPSFSGERLFSSKEYILPTIEDCDQFNAHLLAVDEHVFNKTNFERFFALESSKSPTKETTPVEVKIPVRNRREHVLVEVVAFRDSSALCKARFQGYWLKVELDRASLEKAELEAGDSFEWIPNEEGIVRVEDIKCHPRKADPGEYEAAQLVFEKLNELNKKPRS
jgi:hypothetical protein